MFQIVVVRRLQGRGIFVTEDRNEPNTELTPLPDGTKEERPVILGRKLAAKERRTLLETRNKIKQDFQGNECHISPTTKGGGKIEGPCMHCPICFTYGGLLSGGGGGNYGRAAIVLYDDAFSLGDSDVETLTANSVDTKTQRTGTALMSETFVYGGTFVNVISVRSDILEILNLVLDGIVSTDSYGARSKYYGRVDYFPEVPATPISVDLPPPEGKHLASRELTVTFHFNERIPIPEPQNGGVAMYIHESVVENRIRCSYLRSRGVDVIQWDGTRKDLVKENEIGTLHNLICGTSAVEVGLDAPIDSVFTEWNLPWTSVSREIQRIGRAGRRSSSIPATVHIYVPGTIEVFQQEISKLGGHKMTKSELSLELMKAYHMIQDETLRRSNYVSYYYFNGKDDLVRNGYLESYDELKYSFRPPGSVALFLDENERGAIPFIYDKVSILNRYDTRSPIPEDYERINPGMKRFAAGLGINLDQNDLNQDFLVIRGLRETRDYRKIPDGTLGDLRSDRRRKYYVK